MGDIGPVKTKYEQYKALKSYMAPYGTHATAMAAKKGELEASLLQMDDVIRTYEHSFADQMQEGKVRPGFWARRGLVTNADWALAYFFMAYSLACIAVVVYIYKNSRTPLRGVGIAVFFFFILSLMITALLLRFA
jgi:hypothetical protein